MSTPQPVEFFEDSLEGFGYLAGAAFYLRQVGEKFFGEICRKVGAHVNHVLILVNIYRIPEAEQVHVARIGA